MSTSIDPARRQVLVNLGNRFVVFGPEAGLPEPLHFDPKKSEILPRVAEESDVAALRIVKTLRVAGMTVASPGLEQAERCDLELVGPDGTTLFVDIKVRERDPRQRDFRSSNELIELARSEGQQLEVWFFNIERLKLSMLRHDGGQMHYYELVPLNVWEATPEGILERQKVVDEVEDWARHVERVYADVRDWLGESTGLGLDRTRTVTMSEEMMQNFAVADRELTVLDVLRGDDVIASFVPRGLWLIGAWGRIDIITKDSTSILVAKKPGGTLTWVLSSPGSPRQGVPFDKAGLLSLLGVQ